MGVKINEKKIKVKCPKGHLNHIPSTEWYRCETEIDEKHDDQMGCEYCHRFELQAVSCGENGCSETISGAIEIWEYPDGIEEFRSVSGNVDPDDANDAFTVEL